MTTRNKSKHKAVRQRSAVDTEAASALSELEALLAQGLKDGSIVKDSSEYLQIRRELRKTRDALNMSRRRAP